MESNGEMFWLADGAVITATHPVGECVTPGGCPLHCPSDHALRDAPLVHHVPTGGLGRRCDHGQTHPDIDDVRLRERGATKYVGRIPGWVHQPCDGCCQLDMTDWFPSTDMRGPT